MSKASVLRCFQEYFFKKFSANYYQSICARVTFNKIPRFQLVDASVVEILLFETHLILDVQTASKLQEYYCKNVRWECIKSENHKP